MGHDVVKPGVASREKVYRNVVVVTAVHDAVAGRELEREFAQHRGQEGVGQGAPESADNDDRPLGAGGAARGLERSKRYSWDDCARETLSVLEAVASA